MLKKLKLNGSIRPTRPFRTNTQKRSPFHYRGLECKSRKSRNTWSNRQIWPWNMEWSRAKTNRVLPRKCTGHSKHPLPTTQEKTLHMDITRCSTLKSDWLYSLQPKMEKLYQIRSDQSLSHVRLFATPWIAARQASLSITNSRSSLRLTSIESVMPSSHLILCHPLLLLPTRRRYCPSQHQSLFQWVNSSHQVAKEKMLPLPASESFPMSQRFPSGGQSTGVSASASVLPMNT